jgi:hypothetical protein
MPKEDVLGAIAELGGALVGGKLGGRAADVLDPALTPDHRAVAHGGLAVAALVKLARAGLVEACRNNSAACKARTLDLSRSEDEKARDRMHDILWRFAAGMLIGFIAGYSSHLLLDAGTKRGLPVLGIPLL